MVGDKIFDPTSTPELRDGVEVFVFPDDTQQDSEVLFLFLSNRRKLRIRCRNHFVRLLEGLAQSKPLQEVLATAGLDLTDETKAFLTFLLENSIITASDPLAGSSLPKEYIERQKRQIFFLIDVLRSPAAAIETQEKIYNAHITIFGLGAIGSNILLQLCMLGFRNFRLIDHGKIDAQDIARTPYALSYQIGISKTRAAHRLVAEHAYAPNIETIETVLTTKSDIAVLAKGTTLIVNTADTPYIGYTNIKLSRYAVAHNIPLLAAGGFDAHLGSLGELIIPHETPCADCYATFFEDALKDWTPAPHPVADREGWFGGLGALSSFSAASSTIDILRYFFPQSTAANVTGGRGEFLFTDYRIDSFTVEPNPACPYCGNK